MPDTGATPTPTGPYAAAAVTYWTAGWRGIIPLPARSKKMTLTGWTGNDGAWPSFADVYAWTEDSGDGNLALRLPPNVLGIDVDQYGGKPGYLVMQALEQQLGDLPDTWRSTSRDDGMSGIRLYRIPEGLRWPGILGPGIETIRTGHRYAVAWPSIHPDTGGTYRWITPNGATALGVAPTIDDLPHLPHTWVAHFTKGELATDQAKADLTDTAAGAWLTTRDTAPPCNRMDSATATAKADLTTGTSRHDAALSATNRLVWLAGEGHPGATTALGTLRDAFLKATAGERDPGDAEREWDRMIVGAVRMAAAAHPSTSPDPCDDPFHGLINKKDEPWPVTTAQNASPTAQTNHAPAAGAGPAPAMSAAAPATSTGTANTSHQSSADDLTETQIRRNQAAAQEVERLRAQRTAARILEVEDEHHTIADRVRRRILDDKASREYKRITDPPAPPFDLDTLAGVLARPADPPMRAEGLIPWSGSALVVAQRKTGKTTLLLNYARALMTGEHFLGDFPIIPLAATERVAFLNYEVSAAQLGRWAHEVGCDPDRLILANLRGRRNPLGNDDDRAALAAHLRAANVTSVIVDPFGRAYTGESQNDNGEVQSFLISLELFVREEVGALDLMLATHAGWDGERTRGASALEDWGDVIITMTKDDDDKRFIKAIGRDVDIDEDALEMDPLTRTLTRTGEGGRSQKSKIPPRVAKLAVLVVRAASQAPGCSRADIKRAITGMDDAPNMPRGGAGEDLLTDALKHAERSQRLRCEKGANGGPNAYFEVVEAKALPTTPDHSSTTPGVVPNHHHSSSSRGVVGGSAREHTHTTVERAIAGEMVNVNLHTGEVTA